MSWENEIKFWLTMEDLGKAERRVPICALNNLTPEQKNKIEVWDVIMASLLNYEQLNKVEEALAFDYALEQIWKETSIKVHEYL